MDSKQDAISRAKQAALGSVSLGLKTSGIESDKLKKVSYTAAKEAVLFRKNIETLVTRFKVLDSIVSNVKKVLSSKATANKKLARITSIIVADGNKFKQAEAILGEKGEVSGLIKSVTKDAVNATIGVAAFAAAIPLLLSPTVREYVKSFFTGFLDGLGLSSANLTKLKIALVATATVLGGVFTLRALNSVLLSFNRMKRLAQLVGILAMSTNDGIGEIDVERKKKLEKVKKLKKLKRLMSAASTVLKGSLIAYAVGVSIDAVSGAIIDIATSDDEVTPENTVKVLINNIVESATFGIVKGPFDTTSTTSTPDNIPPAAPSAPNSKPPKPEWNTDPNVIEVEPAKSISSIPADNSTALSSSTDRPSPVSTASSVFEFKPVEQAINEVGIDLPTPINNVMTGLEINNVSNELNIAEENLNNYVNNNLILVNNSTNVYQQSKQNRLYPSLSYSATVGA